LGLKLVNSISWGLNFLASPIFIGDSSPWGVGKRKGSKEKYAKVLIRNRKRAVSSQGG